MGEPELISIDATIRNLAQAVITQSIKDEMRFRQKGVKLTGKSRAANLQFLGSNSIWHSAADVDGEQLLAKVNGLERLPRVSQVVQN